MGRLAVSSCGALAISHADPNLKTDRTILRPPMSSISMFYRRCYIGVRADKDSFDHELNAAVDDKTGPGQRPIRACLLAGSDLLDTMNTPGGEPAMSIVFGQGLILPSME